jgi:predicted hotdog family 3-hydroxylacyl-ACP dehydratase
MADSVLFAGEQIHSLIPQRPPIVMLDAFFDGNDTEAYTGLTVRADNLFCVNGWFTEPGLIEHIAQSASALAGYKAYRRQESAPVGFIGEVRKFRVSRLPAVGEQLRTSVQILSEVLQISLLTAETKSCDETIATCQMKLLIRE